MRAFRGDRSPALLRCWRGYLAIARTLPHPGGAAIARCRRRASAGRLSRQRGLGSTPLSLAPADVYRAMSVTPGGQLCADHVASVGEVSLLRPTWVACAGEGSRDRASRVRSWRQDRVFALARFRRPRSRTGWAGGICAGRAARVRGQLASVGVGQRHGTRRYRRLWPGSVTRASSYVQVVSPSSNDW